MKWILQATSAICALVSIGMAAAQTNNTASAGWGIAAVVFVLLCYFSAKDLD